MDAYERGAAAGLPLNELKEFAVLSAKAADAFEMSSEDVGNAAAGFRTALGIPINQMEKLFDLINGLADSGISDERDIVDFIDRSGAQLKMMGLQNEQIAAYGATLLNLKIPAEVAARAMNTLSTKLLTPKATKKSAKAFATLFGSADEFTKLMKKDANGAVLEFFKRLEKLDKFKRAGLLTDILGQGFSDEINRVVSAMPELIRNLDYAASNNWFGSLSKSYKLQLDTVMAQWKRFRNNLKVLEIDLGDLILPPAADFLDDASRKVKELRASINSLHRTWEALKNAATGQKSGDFDQKGFDITDPWGARKRTQAERVQRRVMDDLANGKESDLRVGELGGDRSTANDPALGAFGARDMEGAWQGNAVAGTVVDLNRMRGETPGEKREKTYQAEHVLGARSAERASMQALKEQYGSYLTPDGQSLARGTDSRDLVDEALAQFANAVLVTTAVIEKATGHPTSPKAVSEAAGIPVPTPRPDRSGELPASAPIPAPRPDIPQKVTFDGTPTVITQPTGVQEVRVTNQPPILRPIVNVTVNAPPNADKHQMAALVGQALSDQLNALSRGSFSDGAN